MKTITVQSCGDCPNCDLCAGEDYCKAIGQFVSLEGIDKDCPLTEMVGREEAHIAISEWFAKHDTIEITGLLDKLGFKEGK